MSFTLRHGSVIEIGDFIVVSYGSTLDYGWYCGNGYNTIQYYSYRQPGYMLDNYRNWEKNKGDISSYWDRSFRKGFSSKLFGKAYIHGSCVKNRVIRISNPLDIFQSEASLKEYERSIEALQILKFPLKNQL